MIEINLLPLSLRKKKRKVELPPVNFIMIGGGILALLLLLTISLGACTHLKSSRLQKTEEELNRLKPKSDKVAYLSHEKQKLEKKMAVVEQLVDKRILWARKLNELSNLIPPQVWLKSLFVEERTLKADSGEEETERRKFLVIQGVAISRRGEESGGLKVVGDFMERIRNDNSFCADLVSVEQRGSILRDKIGDSETMHFELSCQFKEGR